MKLEWMREYRDILEPLIKFANKYAATYKKENYMNTDIPVSYAQIQVLEYLLENEDLQQNMAGIAHRLGITPSTFSKLADKLVGKGLLEKFNIEGNRKNIILQVTDWGRKQYAQYAKFISENGFSPMFAVADRIPRNVLPLVAEMLQAVADPSPTPVKKPSRLIPIDAPDTKEPQ